MNLQMSGIKDVIKNKEFTLKMNVNLVSTPFHFVHFFPLFYSFFFFLFYYLLFMLSDIEYLKNVIMKVFVYYYIFYVLLIKISCFFLNKVFKKYIAIGEIFLTHVISSHAVSAKENAFN